MGSFSGTGRDPARETAHGGGSSARGGGGTGRSRRRLRVWMPVALGALAAAAVLLGGVLPASTPRAPASSPARSFNPDVDPGTPLDGRPAPNFTLTNQFGQPVSLEQFRGKVVILAFVDSECTSICPLTTTSMLQALRMLGAHGRSVQLVGIDANPTATTVADVRAYSAAHDMTHRWDFLTGTTAQLSVVWHQYNVYVAAVHGNIDHEPAVYVIGPRGGERTLFLTQMAYASVTQQAQLLANSVATLLPGRPKVPQLASLRTIPGTPPTTTLSMKVVGGSTGSRALEIGPGHPHLFVFFATWLEETSNLPARLDALNRYAAMARRHRWPTLVLVDEAVTEPSPGSLSGFLRGLTVRLDYPVVVDTTGRLADGYGVLNLPCTVLTSTTGHIVLVNQNWGGWPSITGLEAAVGHAQSTAQRH